MRTYVPHSPGLANSGRKITYLRKTLSNRQILVLLFFFSLIPTFSFCNRITLLKWESLDTVFRFHVATQEPIHFIIGKSIQEPTYQNSQKEYYFSIDILNITQTYEERNLELEDPRVKKILIRSLPEENRLRLIFFPGPGIHWKVDPIGSLDRLLVELRPQNQGGGTKGETSHLQRESDNQKEASSVKPKRPSDLEEEAAPSKSPKTEKVLFSFNPGSQPPLPRGADSQQPAGNPDLNNSPPNEKLHPRKLVIIDPGHGGFNKGGRTFWTVGGRHYVEKDLVLSYAKKLKYLVDRSPNLTATLTRDKDEYISLSDRVEFAQKHEGDLFVSLHLNAAPSRRSATARGVEFFHWRETGSDNAAISYLEKLENDQLLPKLPKTENRHLKRILTSMLKEALEEEKTRSRQLCKTMWETFGKNPYFKKYHRSPPVKSARFVVLANYAMPAILIEVGFLTNKKESRHLISESFQWTTVRLIYNGIQKFFAQEDPGFEPHFVSY